MQKIKRQTHTIDATEQPLGRLAVKVALLLRGKHKTSFVPYWDVGDIVEVKNIKQVKITGKKLQDKIYYHHSGYPGGLKQTRMKEIFKKNPGELLRRAVYNMLPKNKLRKETLKRLKIE